MAVRFARDKAVIEGHCTVEEADALASFLLAKPGRKVDLAACTGLHAAVLQCLMALAPAVAKGPQDAGLSRWLGAVLALPSPAHDAQPRPRRRKTAERT
ncbi:MAG: hypothetical protein ACKO01_04030 [Erythrobacter sp.]